MSVFPGLIYEQRTCTWIRTRPLKQKYNGDCLKAFHYFKCGDLPLENALVPLAIVDAYARVPHRIALHNQLIGTALQGLQ